MRYIAEKKDEDFLITGIKEMETLDGKMIEVKIDSKSYSKETLEECIEAYTAERDGLVEKYNNDLEDMKNILEAINNCK